MRKLFVVAVLALFPAALFAKVVAFAEQEGIRVELHDSKCVAPWPVAQIAEGEKSMGLSLNGRAATYTEKGVKTDGCWVIHPQAPAVILLWEDKTGATVPMEMFQAPGK